MFTKLKKFFEVQGETNDKDLRQLESACAVLLIEISKSDGEASDIEQQAITEYIANAFELKDEELTAVVAKSQSEEAQSTSYYPFVKLINEHYQYDKRVALVKSMWQVAAADGVIDAYEEHTIRKLADLLYVSHSDFIKTKLSVMDHQ